MDKKEAFITDIKNNEGLIYKIAAVYTNTIEDRKDVVQEIIYQLWKSFDSFDQKSTLSTWMYRVALNVAFYHLKKAKRSVSTVPMDGHFADVQETADDGFEEKWGELKLHLDQLNLLDKGIIMLYLENKSYSEIADIVGISETNVGTKMSRIKEKLKKQMTKQ